MKLRVVINTWYGERIQFNENDDADVNDPNWENLPIVWEGMKNGELCIIESKPSKGES